jgi:hypothetical protein
MIDRLRAIAIVNYDIDDKNKTIEKNCFGFTYHKKGGDARATDDYYEPGKLVADQVVSCCLVATLYRKQTNR